METLKIVRQVSPDVLQQVVKNSTVPAICVRDDPASPDENTPLGSSGAIPLGCHPADVPIRLGSSRSAVVLLGSVVRHSAGCSVKPRRHFLRVFQTALPAALAYYRVECGISVGRIVAAQ